MEARVENVCTRIGVDDDSWKQLRRDEALALLHIFDAQEAERRALGAALVAVPDGHQLYVTPRLGF